MVILNFLGRIEPICISHKLGLYISNLPNNKEFNNWNKGIFEELQLALKYRRIHDAYNLKIANKYGWEIPQDNSDVIFSIAQILGEELDSINSIDEDGYLHKIADNMICLYFDYQYDDMPLGDWDTNCFDGRLCEDDYAEKIIEFINFLSVDLQKTRLDFPEKAPFFVYTSNEDLGPNYTTIFRLSKDLNSNIEALVAWGKLFDEFLIEKNSYLQFDYLCNAFHEKHYSKLDKHYFMKLYSLCQMFLENEREKELDKKLPQFLRQSHEDDERSLKAEFLRRIRNKIAHGDFMEYEKEIEEYALKIMDGYFNYDYSEYSRQNWVLLSICCEVEEALKNIIYMAFTNRQVIENIKKSK